MQTNKFTSKTQNMINQFSNNYNINSNINTSFAPNHPLIDAHDFKNKRETLHNNLGSDLQVERVVDYNIKISSSDRNMINNNSNPFNLYVSLGSSNSKPNIKRDLRNIKYITFNSVILPRTIGIDTSQVTLLNQNIYPTNSHIVTPHPLAPFTPLHNLEVHPYLYLRIAEIGNENNLGTNRMLENDTFMIIPDQKLGDMCLWKAIKGAATLAVYPNSKYLNISNLTLTILDENEKQLSIYNHLGIDILKNPIFTTVPYKYNEYVEKYKNDNDIVQYTNNVTQAIYNFTFGVIENELNTLPSFR